MSAEAIIKEHAYHEAGHYTAAIVMAERLKGFINIDVQSISLFHEKSVWGNTVRGELHAPVSVECADDEEPVAPDELTVNIGLGGLAAQAYLRLLATQSHPVGHLEGAELELYVREAHDLSEGAADGDLTALMTHLPQKDWSNWSRTLLPEVLEIVRANWGGLERVAMALLSAPIVSGVQRITAEEAHTAFTGLDPVARHPRSPREG